jgi:IMP cyclohydrolase
MNVYKTDSISDILKNNEYAGRGIIIGTSPDGKYAVCAYFIMGRSENSRNRVFVKEGETVKTEPFDLSKVSDPSLIIYNAVRKAKKSLIVTNGDQTDTVFDLMNGGKSFCEALETREFEPDAPNFTPRISGILYFKERFTYEMSILKSIDENGTDCCRYTYSYPSVEGLGHFIHTYNSNGSPLPTFTGEPHRIDIKDDIEEFAGEIWTSLNEDNKISLYVRYTDIESGEYTDKIINKNGR